MLPNQVPPSPVEQVRTLVPPGVAAVQENGLVKKAALRTVESLCEDLQRHRLPVSGILPEPVFFTLPGKVLYQRRDQIAAA